MGTGKAFFPNWWAEVSLTTHLHLVSRSKLRKVYGAYTSWIVILKYFTRFFFQEFLNPRLPKKLSMQKKKTDEILDARHITLTSYFPYWTQWSRKTFCLCEMYQAPKEKITNANDLSVAGARPAITYLFTPHDAIQPPWIKNLLMAQ